MVATWVLIVLTVSGGGNMWRAPTLDVCTRAAERVLDRTPAQELAEVYCVSNDGNPERVYIVKNGKRERLE